MIMAAYLIVRAVVPETDRAKFDQWYQDVHLPEALAVFDRATGQQVSLVYPNQNRQPFFAPLL